MLPGVYTLAPGVPVERRRVPRMVSVRVRGGIPAALLACVAYLFVREMVSIPPQLEAYLPGFSELLARRALRLLAFAAVMPALLRRDALVDGDIGWRPWTRREIMLGLGAAASIFCATFCARDVLLASAPSARFLPDYAPLAFLAFALDGAAAALLNEVFFRGFLIGSLRARFARGSSATVLYVLASAAAFAALHAVGHPAFGAVYLAVGALLGVVFAMTRSLNVVIVAHAAFNVAYAALAVFGS